MIWNNLLRLFRNSQEILRICITFYSQEILRIFKWAKNNQLKLMKQTSQNKLFKSSLSLFVSKAREKGTIQTDLFNESVGSLLVSLLQWHLSSMRWSTYSHRSTYQWIDLPRVSVSTSEPATRADNDWPRRQSQSFDSESATKAWTGQALLHACSRDGSTVSLLQRRVRYWPRHRASHSIVSLLERHPKWACYKGRQRLISWLSRSTNETSPTM